MKKILIYLLLLLVTKIFAQVPSFSPEYITANNIKTVSEWQYAMEKNGKKYEAIKSFTNIYSNEGLLIKRINHDGVILTEDSEVFEYNNINKIKQYRYYIDTSLVTVIDYVYDTLGNLLREKIDDIDCKDDSKDYYIEHTYSTGSNSNIITDTAICYTCWEAKKVTTYDSNHNIISELKFDKENKTIYSTVFYYDNTNTLTKINSSKNSVKTTSDFKYSNKKLIEIHRLISNNSRIIVSTFKYTFFK